MYPLPRKYSMLYEYILTAKYLTSTCLDASVKIFILLPVDGLKRPVIIVKRFWKLPNLHMLIKQKCLSLPRNLALATFGGLLLIVFLTKVNLLYLHYMTTLRCYLLYLIKQNGFLKTFRRPLISMTHRSLYMLSPQGPIRIYIIFL